MMDNKTAILIFDDEDLVGKIVCKMLEHFGFTATHVVTCSEALTEYQKRLDAGNKFTAVLADLNVPGGDGGRQLVTQILDSDPEAQVFATSGNSLEDAMQAPQHFGFVDTLQKPITLEVIKDFLAKVEVSAEE